MCFLTFCGVFMMISGELAEKTMIQKARNLGLPPGSATDLPGVLSRLCPEGLGVLLLQ